MTIEALVAIVGVLLGFLYFLHDRRKKARETRIQSDTLGEADQMTFAALAINSYFQQEKEDGTLESERVKIFDAHLHGRVYDSYNIFFTGRNVELPTRKETRYGHSMAALKSALSHYQCNNAIVETESGYFEIFRQITKSDIPDAILEELQKTLLDKIPDSTPVDELTKPPYASAREIASNRMDPSIAEETDAKQERERKLEEIDKWEFYLAQLGNDKKGDAHRLQIKRVARKWVEYTIDKQINADRTSQGSVPDFLDTRFNINANTRTKYNKIINDWFDAIDNVNKASSREPRRTGKKKRTKVHESGLSAPGTLSKRTQTEKLIGFVFEGEQYECNSAKETLIAILSLLQERDPHFLDRLSKHPRFRDVKRPLVSRNRDDLYPSPAAAHHYGDLGNGWWVSTKRDINNISEMIELACQVSDIEIDKDLQILRTTN